MSEGHQAGVVLLRLVGRMSLGAAILLGGMTASARADLVGLWRFEDDQNLGFDTSTRLNHLVEDGDPQHSADAKVGTGALLLDGNDFLYATVFPTDVPTGGASYTLAAWINPSAASHGGIVGWGNYGNLNSTNAFRMVVNNPNAISNYWWANDLGGSASGSLITGDHPDGWHHVAVTYDASITTGIDHIIYVDGTPIASRDSFDNINAQAQNFAVGRAFGSELFIGLLDDVAIFNEALDSGQLATIATGDFSEFAVPEPSSFALAAMALGSLGLVALRRRRR